MTEWVQYHYHGAADHDDAGGSPPTSESKDSLDPTKYENQVRQTGRFTASVWALHLNVPSFLVPITLAVLEGTAYLTHEFSTGGSWADWGQPASESSDNHLVIYFRSAQAITARAVGRKLAGVALDRYGGQEYVITTAGDFKERIADTRKREVYTDAPATEAEGESGQ